MRSAIYGLVTLVAILSLTVLGCAGGLKEPLARLAKDQPKTEQEPAQSIGNAVIEKRVVKAPMVGASGSTDLD